MSDKFQSVRHSQIGDHVTREACRTCGCTEYVVSEVGTVIRQAPYTVKSFHVMVQKRRVVTTCTDCGVKNVTEINVSQCLENELPF